MRGRNKTILHGICCPMNIFSPQTSSFAEEKRIYSIYYLMVEEGKEQKEKRQKFFMGNRKTPLEICKCKRNYPFAEGPSSAKGKPVETGVLQIYYSLLPEEILTDMGKAGKRKRWMQKISQAVEMAGTVAEGTNLPAVLFSKDLCSILKRKQELPYELYGALLFQARKDKTLENITLSMPGEHSSLMTDEVLALIEPYLAGTKKVVFTGEETKESMWMEDYLYQEYGIIMDYGKSPAEYSVWIALEGAEGAVLQGVSGRGIYPINCEIIWKFLDTIVKSGYNTKVN